MHMFITWLVLLFAAANAATAAVAGPVIDNERVTVWDVKLTPGTSGSPTSHDEDTVIMFLEGGQIRTVDSSGKVTTAQRKSGDVVFVPRGTDATDTLISGEPAHEVVIALKDYKAPLIANSTGLPAAFPRPGSVKVLDNDRVVVWNYSWAKGQPTPMHFHDKDVVVAYRFDGALKSVTPDGASVVNPYKTGDIRFNKGNRAHYEELVDDRQSAVMMELK
jgi:quercetin dioxygenase-like cupin family protein